MNIGQVLETHLGFAAKGIGERIGRMLDAQVKAKELREVLDKVYNTSGKQEDLSSFSDQDLFEMVPCIITVQDRDYKLVQYNREFAEKFAPQTGDYCYRAYKGRQEKCTVCPVERTFADGRSHTSEETGFTKDGKPTHWLAKTSPIKNAAGEIVAAMEMNLD